MSKEFNLNKIEELQKEIDFIDNNCKFLEENNMKYNVTHVKEYSIFIDRVSLEEFNLIVKHYGTCLNNHIKTAGSKEYLNKSPFVLRADSYSNTHLDIWDYIRVSFISSKGIEIRCDIPLKEFEGIAVKEVFEDEATYNNKRNKNYFIQYSLKCAISKVNFYSSIASNAYNYSYYATNENEVSIINKLLKVK